MKRRHLLSLAAAAALAAAFLLTPPRKTGRLEAATPLEQTAAIPGGEMKIAMVGHEYRQDDLPSMATGPDGSMWLAWLSFNGERDDVAIRRYKDGVWGVMQWVPVTSGDSWLPQVAVDSENRVWVVWSQMLRNNWDIYARRFDPAREEWGPLERLTNNALPDINPRLTSDGKGHFALVYQSFRGKTSNIYMKTFDGGKWSGEVRVSNHAANDWEPAVAYDSKGALWVTYDSYKNGNYDVFLNKVEGGKAGPDITVAATPAFDARATVAVDTQDRVWVAWEQGRAGWGKDQGYTMRADPRGVQLGANRRPRIRCYDNGTWREPAAPDKAFGEANTYQPHIWSDGKGSLYMAAKKRLAGAVQAGAEPTKKGKGKGKLKAPGAARGYWEYHLTHLDTNGWSSAFALPNSRGRSSTRMGATLGKDNALWLVWDTDNRAGKFYHRPLRQQIHAGRIAPAVQAGTLSWGSAPEEFPDIAAAHPNEAADLRSIRAYTVTIDGKPNRIVRGDFHRHTELSWDGGGATDGSLQDFYRYMIDAASMDFGASTDHQGGLWEYWWWYTQKMTDMHHVPGAYTAVFGYERSATFPNGHRNMFFVRRSDARVTPFHLRSGVDQWFLGRNAMGDEPGVGSGDLVANDTKLLYEDIRNRNAIAISHTSGTRMGTDWRDNDPTLEPVVEIFQGARSNYESLDSPLVVKEGKDDAHMAQAGYQPEGMVSNAWAKGYKLGIVTSSDHGSTHISYAMVYTPDNSRQGVLDGIRKRHTYGAMDNIILDVHMGQYFMGDEFKTDQQLPISVKFNAPRTVARVVIVKDSKVIYTTTPKARSGQFEFTDKGDIKGRHYYYVRVEQDNYTLAWSSPFFVNYK
ncbi:MAG: hypothetical protein HY820_25795 [Acidobacteria bacterium]|nr:hypothetical protein [Acidobacteriota bacterium]